ncbi:MAG: ATP-binding protein [Elusimicrobiota bacterium]|jgi:PAS domain S-box-containing protein
MNWFSKSLRKRLTLVMTALALLPSAFLGWQLLRVNRVGMQASVLELHTKLAERTADGIGVYLKNLDDKLRFLFSVLRKPDISWQTRQEMMSSLIESHTDISEVAVMRGGKELLKVYNPDLAQGEVFEASEEGWREYQRTRTRTVWIRGGTDGTPRLDVYYPLSEVTDIRVSVALKTLRQTISAERVGGTGFATLIGPKGNPLIYSEERLPASERAGFPQWPIVKTALGAVSTGSSEFSWPDGRRMVGAYAPVPEIAGAVLIQQPEGEAYLAAVEMKRTALWVIVLICMAAVIVAFTVARRLTEPLLLLTRSAEEIAQGRFPEKVELHTGDELQSFADTFNRMSERLRGYAEMQVDRLVLEQRKTEAILFSIGDGILMADNDGNIQLANRRAREILGHPEGVEGKPIAEVLPKESPLREAVLEVAAKPGKEVIKEIDLSTEEKRLFLRVSAEPLVSPAKNTVQGVVIALHDVTLEKELDQMKEEFLQSITHDLRNPVGSILGFLDFLRKGVVGVLNAQQTSMVESMHKSATRLLGLVNNILDLAKMESGRVEVSLKEASLAGLAGQAIEILSALAQRRGIRVELSAADECTSSVDPDQIARVVQNLLGNAIKFSPDDGKIVVSITEKSDHHLLCVADSGPGIPASHLEKIFAKFEQVPGQKRGGTGLGLTISKRFVEAHLGRIWVESELGKGAQFYFTLPKNLRKNEAGEVLVAAPVPEKP